MDRCIFRRRNTGQFASIIAFFVLAQGMFANDAIAEYLGLANQDERVLRFEDQLPFSEPAILEEFQKLTKAEEIDNLNIILAKVQPIRNAIMPLVEAHDLPSTILAVMIVESEGNTRARSRSGAAGLWQIMKNTMGSGLRIDEYRDDRYDLLKSTKLALGLLRYYFEKYEDWTFALAAYNAGDGRISAIKKKYPTETFFELCGKKVIPNETRFYVPRIMALSYLLSKPERFGLNLFWNASPSVSFIEIKKPISISSLEESLGLKQKEIQKLNSELFTDSTPLDAASHIVKVPGELETQAIIAISTRNLEPKFMYYRIKQGDTLYKISKEYAIKISVLTSLNPTLNARALRIGLSLKIPYVRGKN